MPRKTAALVIILLAALCPAALAQQAAPVTKEHGVARGPTEDAFPKGKVPLESLSAEQFKNPGAGYRPIDCWWWDGGYLNEEKLKWQLEDLHAKGVGGTWLYPRFGASQPLSAEPGFWTDGW